MSSKDLRRQLSGYGLTTAQILYRRPEHPWLLGEGAVFGDGRALPVDQAGGVESDRRRIPTELSYTRR